MMPTHPNQPKTEQPISNGSSNSHGANEIPNTSPSKIESHYQTHQPYYGWNLRHTTPYQRTNIAIMILIFIVTGTYAYFSYLQWDVINKSMKLDQRAWIGIESITPSGEIGKPMEVCIRFINTGKTPAKNVVNASIIEIPKENTPPNFTAEQYVLKESKGIRAPQQKFIITHRVDEKHPFSDVEISELISGKLRLYVHGIVEYNDIFGYPHWLTYCGYLAEDRKTFAAYKEHNDTDDK